MLNNDSQYLKWKMEMIWKHKPCMCPNHLTQWFIWETGYRCYVEYGGSMLLMLWFKRGSIRRPRGKRPKGKGFSFHPLTVFKKNNCCNAEGK